MQDEVTVTQADREAAYGAYFECYDTAPNDLWLQAMLEGRHDEDSLIQVLARHRHQAEREEEEAHKIGISEGRQEMVREIDLATGGDGEFRWSTEPDRHCPCEEAMKARVIERFHQAERETLARMEWRDIESAPKDGTRFLAWCPYVGRVIMRIDGVHRETWAIDPSGRLGCNPTKWMPLPPAPEAGQ